MPSTNEATLQLIQKEISEVVQRERELKEAYALLHAKNESPSPINGSDHTNGHHLEEKVTNVSNKAITSNGTVTSNGSVSSNGTTLHQKSNSRLFTPNPTTRGVMQRFIKSKGKMGKLSNTAAPVTSPIISPSSPTGAFALPNLDFFEPPNPPVLPTGTPCRNGYVPVNERIKREFVEMEKRESELRLERRKSQSDLTASETYGGDYMTDYDQVDNSVRSSPPPSLYHARTMSISQMSYDSRRDSGSTINGSSSLKTAKSLADLCDVDNEEISSPGSLTLIKQWESLIKQRQAQN